MSVRSKAGGVTLKFLRVDSNYFSFLSGIFASVGMGLLTGVLSLDQLPRRWPFIVMSGLLTAASAVAWAVLAWTLAAVERSAIEAAGVLAPDTVWSKLAAARRTRLLLSLMLAVGCALLGMAALMMDLKVATNTPERHAEVRSTIEPTGQTQHEHALNDSAR